MKTIPALILTVFLIFASVAGAASLPGGYATLPWGTDVHTVMKKFPKGEMGTMGEMVVYRQLNPNKQIRQRMFGFDKGKLKAVSVSFAGPYVKKTGLEKLLAQHRKSYGEGTVDNSKAPHMVSYVWEDATSRIIFTYAPKRPEMTVVNYTQK
ncbi:hypothetical protein [Geobacter pickeringii]|uniref:Lipoprotein n=1 Tax=Geobacter pickeringii TaxID=345632 RepID=A0A0B5BHY7_9BACT|nr:hypothetical protein [Geobacter pickeringii]AJE04100.1 hypothetical protein GPICK_12675 [Geobacter pickeringii]